MISDPRWFLGPSPGTGFLLDLSCVARSIKFSLDTLRATSRPCRTLIPGMVSGSCWILDRAPASCFCWPQIRLPVVSGSCWILDIYFTRHQVLVRCLEAVESFSTREACGLGGFGATIFHLCVSIVRGPSPYRPSTSAIPPLSFRNSHPARPRMYFLSFT